MTAIDESGRRWRLRTIRADAAMNVEDDGELDELVLDDWFHVERMDDDLWWLRVGDVRIMVKLRGDGVPEVDVERGAYSETCGSTITGQPPT